MTSRDERDLGRYLAGELDADERRVLRARAAGDPALAARLVSLEATWRQLELPSTVAVPAGFATGVVARARAEADRRLSWSLAPTWVRATAAAMLVAGVGLGVGLGLWQSETTSSDWEITGAPSLAEGYWQTLETSFAEEAAP